MTKVKAIEVVDMETNEVVHTIDIKPPAESDSSRLERTMSGVLRNSNTERFMFREVEES
jgi:hypothetical protein